jgi:mono/diheme cytochrome c family protein
VAGRVPRLAAAGRSLDSRPVKRVAVLAAVVVAGAVASGCGGSPVASSDEADLANGLTLFQQRCGGCHALEHAQTQGVQGPNLDDAYLEPRLQGFDSTSFQAMVLNQIVSPSPPMPADLVTGQDAKDVAAYVAAVAAVDLAKRYREEGGEVAGG